MSKKKTARPDPSGLPVEWVPLDKIIEYEHNPKKHPEHQVKKIAEQIELYGFHPAIELDRDGVIIAGHGRKLAAKRLGRKEAPCVRRKDLTAREARGRRLGDNVVAESPWDEDLLRTEFDVLATEEGMSHEEIAKMSGFDKDVVEDLLKASGEATIPPDGSEGSEGEDSSGVKTYKKDPNIIIRISVHPGLWAGKRDEIRQVLFDMEKAYNCKISIEE